MTTDAIAESVALLFERQREWHRQKARQPLHEKVRILLELQRQELCTWKTGDKVELELPMHLHAEAMPDDPTQQAFLYGPLVLAGDLGSEGLTEAHICGRNLRVGAPNVEQSGSPLAAVNQTPPIDYSGPILRHAQIEIEIDWVAAVGIYREQRALGWPLGLLIPEGAILAYVASRTIGQFRLSYTALENLFRYLLATRD